MRARHKPPTLVSMWMLDVFCCALGCVTLLWLLNNRAASEQAERANSSQQDLAAARDDLAAVKRRLNAEIEALRAKLVRVGESTPRGVAADAETAAWTMVANLLLNLDETVCRN